jgi:hypothetical protein
MMVAMAGVVVIIMMMCTSVGLGKVLEYESFSHCNDCRIQVKQVEITC